MFYHAKTFTGMGVGAGSIDAWDTSKVVTMHEMFFQAYEFNAPIQRWDVGAVTKFQGMFDKATKFDQPVGQWNIINVGVGGLDRVFQPESNSPGASSGLSSCNKRLIADAWANNAVFQATNTWYITNSIQLYTVVWASETCPPQTNDNFKQATWDWVNLDTRVASAKWGAIAKWDTSGVVSFDHAFSQSRNEAGMYFEGQKPIGNPKAEFFNADLPWTTTSVTSMTNMFVSARSFNGNISSFNTAKVTHMGSMFSSAVAFNGDVSGFNTAKVKAMYNTFRTCSVFNSDVSKWDTANVGGFQK